MAQNPYQPPLVFDASNPQHVTDHERSLEGARFTQVMESNLARMRPWMLFMGVIALLLSGLVMMLGVLGALLGLVTMVGGRPEGGFAIILSLVYVLFSGIYGYPGWQLWQSGSQIRAADRANDASSKEVALEAFTRHQSNFWRFIGITTLVVIGLYALILVVVVASGLLGALATGG